jgi:hypothetical protein
VQQYKLLIDCKVSLSIWKTTRKIPGNAEPQARGSLTLREEHIVRVFENRVVRRIFGPMRDEVTGE